MIAARASGPSTSALIKGGNVLELLGRVKSVAFDKTGTVTQGKPEVTGIRPIGFKETELLRLAVAVE